MTGTWILRATMMAGMLAGCASAPQPNGQLESTAAAIRAAQEVGATGVPQAALHLQMAQDEMARANALISRGQAKQGGYVLMRAQSDAELAVALSRAQAARVASTQATERVRTLNQQNPQL